MTLRELRERHGEFDIIKLDVEGMNAKYFSATPITSRGAATIWVECNEDARSLDVADLLLSWGLDVYYFAFPSHNPDNFGLAKPILPWAYEAGLLAVPKMIPIMLSAELLSHRCILHRITSRAELEEAMWFTPRWLPDDLANADEATLAAVAGRALSGQARPSFLLSGARMDTMTIGSASRSRRTLSRAQRKGWSCRATANLNRSNACVSKRRSVRPVQPPSRSLA